MSNNLLPDLTGTIAALDRGETDLSAVHARAQDRLERYGAALNAVALRLTPDLPADAAALPLRGLPLAHKDMFFSTTRPTSCGSRIMAGHQGVDTATVLERLAQAGGVEVATLGMSEFAQAPTGHNGHYGAVRNPHDRARVSGGSSSGSGAAVAAGLVLGSLGSDTGGSIRIPASVCGVTGLKPTWGRVPLRGAMPLAPSFDCIGPLARSARDCALLLQQIAGHDPRDGDCARLPVPDYTAALNGDLRGLRIGVPDSWFLDGVSPDIAARFEAALAALVARGATVRTIILPNFDHILACAAVASRVEVASQHRHFMRTRAQDYAIQVSARMYPGYAIPGTLYLEAMRARAGLLRAFVEEVFGSVDLVATPTLKSAPPTIAESDVAAGLPGAVQKFLAVSRNTRQISFLGLPAISVPMGPDALGLPTGLQLIARPFAEARLLRAADAYQRDSDWHLIAPKETP